MTEQKPLQDADLQKATSRRSRKDEEGRDFICGCGKKYLSYPALYTHIKTKHDGRQPEGTLKTGMNVVGKRAKLKFEEETLKILYLYLDKEDIKVLSEIEESFVGTVPIGERIKKDQVAKEIYDSYLSLLKSQIVHLHKNSTLDMVLTVYLLNIGEHVSDKLYDHYLIFAKILRACYFEHAEEVYKTCFSKKDGVAFLPRFNLDECKYLPIICDFMVRYYIPASETAKEYRDLNLSLMELLLFDFCTWMYKRELTYVKVELNKDYQLTQPVTSDRIHCSLSKQDSSKEHQSSDSKKDGDQDDEDQDESNEDLEDEDHSEKNQEQELPQVDSPKEELKNG